MSPELRKYLLIGMFVCMLAAVACELSKSGFKLTSRKKHIALFKNKGQRGKDFRSEVVVPGIVLALVVLLEQCGYIGQRHSGCANECHEEFRF
ncbi:MAG: hypothetical protein OET44_13535 [Gammaproteobacteria bacterium]|nr:hypothetical protein [Gammaproteobacteria bacterium]